MQRGLPAAGLPGTPAAMNRYAIRADDVTAPDVVALLEFHLAEMHRFSPPESCHVMPVERLRQPDVTFFSAWHDGQLAAVGAIKQIDARRGELKSMRAAPAYRGKGAGQAMLDHLIAVARERGYGWLGLETGTPEPFLPAFRLYSRNGFAECAPFEGYVPDVYSRFMELQL
ncbi:MAG: putative N-acetyltransferase YsnE [Pseudomonadota bacterium]|jgi:putative acetyltransferase